MYTSATTIKISMEFHNKLKIELELSCDPALTLLGVYSKASNSMYTDILTYSYL